MQNLATLASAIPEIWLLASNTPPLGDHSKIMSHFFGYFEPPPPVSQSVTPDSTPTNIMSHWNQQLY